MYVSRQLLFLILIGFIGGVAFGPHEALSQPDGTGANRPIAWTAAPVEEQRVIEAMLESTDWAFRVLALMRLDRYEGEPVRRHAAAALGDASWQVRCHAIRHAVWRGMEIDPATLADEQDPRVVRVALLYGVALDPERVHAMAEQLLLTRTVDALMLGIEIGALSKEPAVRSTVARRTLNVVRNMDRQVAAVIGRRLARVLQLDPQPASLAEWQRWLSAQNRNAFQLPQPPPVPPRSAGSSLIAQADTDHFLRLRDYFSALRQRDLDLVVLIDSTVSMAPSIDAVKADVDALLLFMSDLSSTLRLGICAYRDYDNPGRLIEAHPFSTDLESLRNFLFALETPGGPTYPEAVFAGLNACRQYDWRPAAERQIILIGDAPPNEHELSDTRRILEWYRENGFTVHAVHVPMQWREDQLRSLSPTRARERLEWIEAYNRSTRVVFGEIANFGGGMLVELDVQGQHELVRSVMRLTIEREWWPYFDEFYDSYLELCR